jgi:hypothetical protein
MNTSAAGIAMECLACGFCTPGPTRWLWPVLPVWAAVFVAWSALRLKCDAEPARATGWWLLGAVAVLVMGPVWSVSLWSGFLLVWTLHVADRLVRLRRAPADGSDNGTSPGARRRPGDRPLPIGDARTEAMRFHARTLVLLGVALVAKTALHVCGMGVSLG